MRDLGSARWQPNISVALLLEYEAVLTREAANLGMSSPVIDDILAMVCRQSRHHAVRLRIRPALADSNDEFVLELAVACAAHAIVTHNVADFAGAERYGLAILTPGQFLRTIEAGRDR